MLPIKGLHLGSFAVFSSKLHKYNSLLPYPVVIYFLEKEKNKSVIGFLLKDLSKVDFGPKTLSVQSKNLKKLGNFFKLM